MKYALPHSVHTRLVEQHPENSRTVSDAINFLLKGYTRPAQSEEKMKVYHNEIGGLDHYFDGSNHLCMHVEESEQVLNVCDKHLVGIQMIKTIFHVCRKYVVELTTEEWFQEALYTHQYIKYIAQTILPKQS